MSPHIMLDFDDNMLHDRDNVMIKLVLDIFTAHVNVHLVKLTYLPYEWSC